MLSGAEDEFFPMGVDSSVLDRREKMKSDKVSRQTASTTGIMVCSITPPLLT